MNITKIQGEPIDATRGKPHETQVELMNMQIITYISENGTDVRNYGGNDGLPEMKQIFAQLLDVAPQNIIVGGNSSLNMMFDCVATLVMKGIWKPGQKFLCPAPGYDRHFAICEYFDLKMLTVPMTPNGPDMDVAEELVKDPDVVGMWNVPVFSNPQGYVYSDDTIKRLAKMPAANPAFRLLWDNAYPVHQFNEARPVIANILAECIACGHENRPIMFTSFSKISIPGAAVVCMAGHESALAVFRERIAVQTIGPDKINQLRHVQFFRDLDGVTAHMEKHADIIRPKFELAYKMLGAAGANFTRPNGGYFISIETPKGCAKKVWQLCKDAGVLLTPAGATFPYGVDPADTNLRLAPTYLTLDELHRALEVLCTAIKIANG